MALGGRKLDRERAPRENLWLDDTGRQQGRRVIMSINCAVTLRWDSTPEQQRALGAALWSWCHRAARSVGMYPYLDNQALADLLAGRLPASGATGWDAGLPHVQFTVPGD